MARVLAVVPIGLAVLAIACNNPVEVCTVGGSPAFIAEVRDASSGAPAAFGAALITTFGTLVDTTTPHFLESEAPTATTIMSGMGYRPGRWSVVVQKAGYDDWSAADVQLEPTRGCKRDESVVLDVRLVPSAAAR